MELECSLFSSFRTYPDSTFFKSISCLYFEDGNAELAAAQYYLSRNPELKGSEEDGETARISV